LKREVVPTGIRRLVETYAERASMDFSLTGIGARRYRMKKVKGLRAVVLACCGLVLSTAAVPAMAGRIVAIGRDPGFEITRIVSQFRLPGAAQAGTSETIAPAETVPTAPVAGETIFYGTSNKFPEFGKVSVWNGQKWVDLDPANFHFESGPMQNPTANPQAGPFATTNWVMFRFPANKVNLIQNRWVQFQIFPMPPVPSDIDNIEQLFVRAP
jgi:hypothetical protein